MKRVIRLSIIIIILGCQSNLCIAQINTGNNYDPMATDSVSQYKMALEMAKIANEMDSIYWSEHNLHKDNKDSAWINDFNGNIVYDSRMKSKEGKAITIIDSVSNNYYVLDSTHTFITAYNKSNKIIWKTNPRKDNSLEYYRHKNPVIIHFQIIKIYWNDFGEYKKGDRAIFIKYDNSQSGCLDFKTGKFTYAGRD
ncbi:MAG: hypothetical protein WCL51_18460 [Bacteroidota bacterium]